MNRYEKYKDSGIAWLGEVPEHWNVKRLKFLGDIILGLTYSPENITNEDNGTLVLRSSNIQNGKLVFEDNVFVNSDIPQKMITTEQDILICSRNGSRSLIGKCALIEKYGLNQTFGAFMTVYRTPYRKFVYYALNSEIFKSQLGLFLTSTINQLTTQVLGNFNIAFPPRDEQTAIAHYLDTKLGEIDALIDKQQTLLEKLAERRTATITAAVTRGLNPNAPMKNSGVEWLGDVPAHWEMKRLRFTLSLNPVKSELNIPEDTLVSFVPMEAVNFDKDLTLSEERNLDEVYKGYTYFKNGDVILAKITPCFENGKSAIAQNLTNGIAFGTTELHVLRSQDSINNHFLYYLIKSDSFMKIGESEMYGAGGQKRVPEEFIKNFLIGLPPYYEQAAIADYLDQETAKIDRLCDTVNQTIGRLKEYRTALITQAVTGKIKVTDE